MTQVVILAGGLGTRSRGDRSPAEADGRGRWPPILWHIMKIYATSGFKEFVMCTGYKGEMIKEYFLNYAR